MNKRLILLAAALFFPMISQADVIFFNKNIGNSDLEVTYKFCNWQQDAWKCGEASTAKAGAGGASKNYVVIPAPELPVGAIHEGVFVLSSVVKDLKGNIIAQGSYDQGVLVASYDFNTGSLSKFGWSVN